MSQKAIKLETGIPMPRKSKYIKWPLEDMKIGQSFVVDGAHVQRLRMAISQWKARHDDGRDWSTRMIPGGNDYRCWRVA